MIITCSQCKGAGVFTSLVSTKEGHNPKLLATDCIAYPVDCDKCGGKGKVEIIPPYRSGRNAISLVK